MLKSYTGNGTKSSITGKNVIRVVTNTKTNTHIMKMNVKNTTSMKP